MNPSGVEAATSGAVLAGRLDVPPEIALGRWLAFCAHPTAAWRVLPPSGRWLLAASYAAGSFAGSLTLLLML